MLGGVGLKGLKRLHDAGAFPNLPVREDTHRGVKWVTLKHRNSPLRPIRLFEFLYKGTAIS